jgi:hypothetical protein
MDRVADPVTQPVVTELPTGTLSVPRGNSSSLFVFCKIECLMADEAGSCDRRLYRKLAYTSFQPSSAPVLSSWSAAPVHKGWLVGFALERADGAHDTVEWRRPRPHRRCSLSRCDSRHPRFGMLTQKGSSVGEKKRKEKKGQGKRQEREKTRQKRKTMHGIGRGNVRQQ